MKHSMIMLKKQSLVLLVMAGVLLLSVQRVLAGGGFVPVQVDGWVLSALEAGGGNGHPTAQVHTTPVCPVHGTLFPHACDNPAYALNWNPIHIDLENVSEASPQAMGNLSPQQYTNLLQPEQMYYPGMEVPGWTRVGTLQNSHAAWTAEHGNDPNWILMDMMTNVPRWAIFKRDVPIVQQAVVQVFQIQNYSLSLPASFDETSPAPRAMNNSAIQAIFLDGEEDFMPQIQTRTADNVLDEAASAPSAESAKQLEMTPQASLALHAWPNPTMGRVTASLQGAGEAPIDYVVLDNRGQVVKRVAGEGEKTVIDLSVFASGVYHVQAFQAGEVRGRLKLVLTH